VIFSKTLLSYASMQVPRSQKELSRMSKPLSHGNKSECKKKAQVSNFGKAKRKNSSKAQAASGQVGTETVHHPIFSPLIDSLPDPPFSAGFKDGLNRAVNAVGKAIGSLFPDANDTSQRISRRR
jgi:hypothetical protein